MYNLLIVEDESFARNHLEKYANNNLSEYYCVYSAKNAEEALEFIEKDEIDVVVTDIRMPGMSGIELAEIIYESYRYITVMIISGYEEFEYAKKAIRYNVKEYFVKPFDLQEFKNALINAADELDERRKSFFEKEEKHFEAMELAKKYIEENYHKNISREDVARAAFFSPVYFAKNFKLYTGMNYNDYLIKIRMEKAMELMRQNKYKIYEIAKRVGYENTKYFFKVFKLYTGYTPKDYIIKFSVSDKKE